MAALVRAWPTEPLPGVAARDPAGSGPAIRADAGDTDGVEIDLGRSAAGRLVRRRDPRVGRWIVVEERDAPLDEPALAELRAVAAAGGPHLQRVLGISDDRRSVVYEAIVEADTPANVVRIDALPAAERAALAAALAGLHAAGADALAQRPGATAARTEGGWVVLVAPAAI